MSSDGYDDNMAGSDVMDDQDDNGTEVYYDESMDGFSRLNGDAKILDEKRRRLAEEFHRKQCPFRPTITHRENNFQRSQNVFDSLYENSKHRKEKQEKKAEQLRDQQLNELSFTPQINRPSYRPNGQQATDRLYTRAMRTLEDNFQKTLDVRNIDEQCYFKPNVNPKSHKLVKNKVGVIQRLAPTSEQMVSRMKQLEKVKESLDSDGCTFAPQINSKSKMMSPSNGDAFVRLYEKYKENKRKQAELKRTYDHDLTEQMTMVLPTKSGRLNRTNRGDVFERLYESRMRRSFTPPGRAPHVNHNINNSSKETSHKTKDVAFKPTLLSKKGKAFGTESLYQKGVQQIKNRNKPENNRRVRSDSDN